MSGVTVSLAREKLGSLSSVGRSLMPDGLLSGYKDEQLRDLFACIRPAQPLVVRKTK